MTTIHSLNKSISDMPEDEAIILVRELRRRRFIVPERKREVIATKREGKKVAEKKIVNVLQAMSSEDRAALIKMLEESE